MHRSRGEQKGTDMVYKQHRFNLQREETEGFAKLLVLLAGVRHNASGNGRGNASADPEENIRRLIGYFDLDPNRLAWPWPQRSMCFLFGPFTSCLAISLRNATNLSLLHGMMSVGDDKLALTVSHEDIACTL